MITKQLFEEALGIGKPWYIENVNFDLNKERLDISINFDRGSKFKYFLEDETSEDECSVHDTVNKSWRHLNFFQHECYLNCRVPRVKLKNGKVRHIKTPWEGKSLGFTLLLEAYLVQLCSEMPINAVSRLTNIDDNKIWRMLNNYVNEARKYEDFSKITQIGIDETSMRKHHNYVTLFVDLFKHKTIFVTEGKDSNTIKAFCNDFQEHHGNNSKISDVSCDMSPAFIKGVKANLPNANITFDKFHLIKIINEAVGEVRRLESKENNILKGTKNIFDKNRNNMTEKQLEYMKTKLEITSLRLKTVRAYHIKETFQDIYQAKTKIDFVEQLTKWYSWARRCRLDPMKEVAKTIKNHWSGVIQWFESKINNGILEGLNSLIQSAKSKARGFKTFKNFRTIIYLITGDLCFEKVNPIYKPLK